jgi:predicted Zn-dependent protease with MMP-like domain
MPEVEPPEEAGGEPLSASDEVSSRDKNEQSARSFFALLCFFMAFVFLISFLNNSPGGITGVLVLFGIFAFGLGGMYLLSPRGPRSSSLSQADKLEPADSPWGSSIGPTSIESLPANIEDPPGTRDELSPFEMLVEEALSSIPAEFQERMANLAVLVETAADEEVLRRVGIREGYTLLGLYEGVPLTAYGQGYAGLPERITVYQQAIEAYCQGDPQRIREQVRSTVLHEVAHHFGMEHEEMPIWMK